MNMLKYRREKLHLTQRQVAEKVGIAEQAYQQYEYGKMLPSVVLGIKIAKTLKTTTERLWDF